MRTIIYSLEESMTTHSSILAWRIPKDRGAWGLQCMGSQSQTRLSDKSQHLLFYLHCFQMYGLVKTFFGVFLYGLLEYPNEAFDQSNSFLELLQQWCFFFTKNLVGFLAQSASSPSTVVSPPFPDQSLLLSFDYSSL